MTPDHGASDERGSAERLMSLVDGYLSTQLIYVAAELSLADVIADSTITADELARALAVPALAMRRILRGLAAIGILEEASTDGFALTRLGELLRADHPRSLRGAVLVLGRIYYETMGALLGSLTEQGTPFERTHGSSFFGYLEQHPEQAAVFQSSMASRSRREAAAVVASYSFSRYRRIIDIGGGNGTLLGQILAATPTALGVLFDRPAAVAAAVDHLGGVVRPGSWKAVDGDFFERVPPGGDLYILSRVLHDWNDRDATAILVNCRQAMDSASCLVVIEAPLPHRAADQQAAIRMDIHMLALFEGGRERTISEYSELLDAAGLRLLRTIPLQSAGIEIIEAGIR